jgi:RNA polymerase-binding transcription factor DksA
LTELREHILRRQGGLAREAAEQQPAFSLHMADAGTDTFDRDFALGMLSSEQDALYEIDEALNRIRDGTYGKCELTGKPIEAARLEAIPWTRFSADAEKQLERDGAVKKARLGPRETVAKTAATAADDEEDEE